jgi:hypothetical protein
MNPLETGPPHSIRSKQGAWILPLYTINGFIPLNNLSVSITSRGNVSLQEK